MCRIWRVTKSSNAPHAFPRGFDYNNGKTNPWYCCATRTQPIDLFQLSAARFQAVSDRKIRPTKSRPPKACNINKSEFTTEHSRTDDTRVVNTQEVWSMQDRSQPEEYCSVSPWLADSTKRVLHPIGMMAAVQKELAADIWHRVYPTKQGIIIINNMQDEEGCM